MQILLQSVVDPNHSVCNLQRFLASVQVFCYFFLSVHLFLDEKLLTLLTEYQARHLKSAFQNKLVNLGSRSDTIILGIPCNLNIVSKKSFAISGAVAVVVVG